jgi:hypothetical protein
MRLESSKAANCKEISEIRPVITQKRVVQSPFLEAL